MLDIRDKCKRFEDLDQSIDSASIVMDYIFDTAQTGDVTELDLVMGELDVSCGGFVVTCFLRGSYMVSASLRNWKPLRNRYITYCEANGIDYKEHMYGLMPEDDQEDDCHLFRQLVGVKDELINSTEQS